MFNVNKIYALHKEKGILNLIFYNLEKNEIIEFDGFLFKFKKNINHVPKIYEEIDYSKITSNVKIVELRQDWGDTFILLNNNNILQISSIPNTNEIIQILLIFNEESKKIVTPLGLTEYELALKNFKEADVVDTQPCYFYDQ